MLKISDLGANIVTLNTNIFLGCENLISAFNVRPIEVIHIIVENCVTHFPNEAIHFN